MSVTQGQLQNKLFAHPFIQSFNPYSKAVFNKLNHCHTAHIGMHRFQCDQGACGFQHWQYHSCGNRHCPNCGAFKKEQWIDFKTSELLPTAYYHVVFTLPHELNPLIMGNRKLLFDLLFQASAHTLLTLGKDEKYLGAETGFTSILHTWGQDLSFHPHIHCIVSAGGIKEGKWIKEKRVNNKFIFPQGSMQMIYKGFVMEHLRKLYKQKLLQVDESVFKDLLTTIGYKKWNVYAKSPFGGPAQVVEYLGRYTHKIAITRHRILEMNDTHIQFRYKDYADGDTVKEMTLTHQEFLRRFEQHILPKRYVKIRNFGYLRNYGKTSRLQALRKTMSLAPMPPRVAVSVRQRMLEKYGKDISICPTCNKGTMMLMQTIYPPRYGQITKQMLTFSNKADPDINS